MLERVVRGLHRAGSSSLERRQANEATGTGWNNRRLREPSVGGMSGSCLEGVCAVNEGSHVHAQSAWHAPALQVLNEPDRQKLLPRCPREGGLGYKHEVGSRGREKVLRNAPRCPCCVNAGACSPGGSGGPVCAESVVWPW